MRNQNYSAGIVRVCAWCGITPEATAQSDTSWLDDHGTFPAGPHTHTICHACLATYFAEDMSQGAVEAPFEPVPVLRRR